MTRNEIKKTKVYTGVHDIIAVLCAGGRTRNPAKSQWPTFPASSISDPRKKSTSPTNAGVGVHSTRRAPEIRVRHARTDNDKVSPGPRTTTGSRAEIKTQRTPRRLTGHLPVLRKSPATTTRRSTAATHVRRRFL